MANKIIKIGLSADDIQRLDALARAKDQDSAARWSRSTCVREAVTKYLAEQELARGERLAANG